MPTPKAVTWKCCMCHRINYGKGICTGNDGDQHVIISR
jgi:hypothetical protein